ncbi:MAG: class I SAM-dependent methyltransferase [Candidatus Hodarchaeota archaeon]
MSDTDTYMQRLLVTDPLSKPVVLSAIQALKIPQGSRGLDIGCGIGTHAMMMAEVVGSTGHVTGIDIEPEFLAYAKRVAEKTGLSETVSFQEGNMNKLPFNDKTFDWAWSVNLVGYHPADPLPPLREMVRVVKPGGTIALLLYSSQMLLPGYPLLEAKLNATSSGIAPFTSKIRPEFHSLRALRWFREVGLGDTKAQTFVGSIQAPMSDDIRNALTALIQMRWVDVQTELSEEDWIEYQRLCRPESPDYILNYPDYYGFFTYSLFCGQVSK